MNIRLHLLLSAFLIAVLAAPAHAERDPVLTLDLNIPALRLDVYEGAELVKSYPVAVGKPGHDTPIGEYTMDHAEWNPWWRPPPGRAWTQGKKDTPPGPDNPMGRVKLFFAPLYFIHGTPEAESIGSPASHGCVRMRNADAVELARLVHRHAAPGVSSSQIDRILAQSRTTRTVRFEEPVQVIIRYDPIAVEEGQLRIYPDLYGYNRHHSEGVFQALVRAGYRVDEIDMGAVRDVLARASKQKGTFSIPVDEAFPRAIAVGAAGR
jgi:murein L,D-transpeptidase YcbB/YkuD